MIEAAPALTTDKSVRLFEKFGIFTKVELLSREEIIYETYAKTINIEALTMIDMAAKQIIPACMKYERDLANTIIAVKTAGAVFGAEAEKLQHIADKIDEAQEALDALRALEESTRHRRHSTRCGHWKSRRERSNRRKSGRSSTRTELFPRWPRSARLVIYWNRL